MSRQLGPDIFNLWSFDDLRDNAKVYITSILNDTKTRQTHTNKLHVIHSRNRRMR